MTIAIKKLLAVSFVFTMFGTITGSAALAQAIPQDPVSKAAVDVQQRAAAGQISAKEAGQIEGKLWQLKSEEQQDMAHHGGYLTPQDNQRLWSQIHSIEGGSNFDGKNWHSSPRHSKLLNNNYNQGGYPGVAGVPNGYNPGYNNGYNPGYNNGYNNGYNGGNGYNNGYNNGYQNGGYNNGSNGYNNAPATGSKFSQAAGILQNLLHH